jgi:hypothetical protein
MAVLNKHHGNIPTDAIYIGRGSKWGNPFVIGKHGDRDEVCELHKKHLDTQIVGGRVSRDDLIELHGKDLMCYCAPARCHGDTLEKYASDAINGEGIFNGPTLGTFNLIIAGGRKFTNFNAISNELTKLLENELKEYTVNVITGMADGADITGRQVAINMGIAYTDYPADWKNLNVPGAVIRENKYGKYNARAGHDRNQLMADAANGLLAFHDGKSTGTRDMIARARRMGLSVRVINY